VLRVTYQKAGTELKTANQRLAQDYLTFCLLSILATYVAETGLARAEPAALPLMGEAGELAEPGVVGCWVDSLIARSCLERKAS
jgi:hypothetical protein